METLKTFQLTNKKEIISPILVTIREYRRWFEKVFGEYISKTELYMKSKRGGEVVYECHPGTRIGKFFDTNKFSSSNLHSWYILQDSPMMNKLVDYGMAELRDAIPISVNDEDHRNMIRVYTVEQVQCYIRTNIDKQFNIAPYVDISRHVPVRDCDMDKLTKPKMSRRKFLRR